MDWSAERQKKGGWRREEGVMDEGVGSLKQSEWWTARKMRRKRQVTRHQRRACPPKGQVWGFKRGARAAGRSASVCVAGSRRRRAWSVYIWVINDSQVHSVSDKNSSHPSPLIASPYNSPLSPLRGGILVFDKGLKNGVKRWQRLRQQGHLAQKRLRPTCKTVLFVLRPNILIERRIFKKVILKCSLMA